MFLEFKQIFKQQKTRGWSIQKEKNHFYLSKFDNGLNDDEYRIFLVKTAQGVEISHADKLKYNYRNGTNKILPVSLDHEMVLEAEKLIRCHPLNKKRIHS